MKHQIPDKVPENLAKQGVNLPTYRAHVILWSVIREWQIKQMEKDNETKTTDQDTACVQGGG